MFDSDSTDKLTAPIPAVGFSPNAGGEFSQENYHHPAAGWGAAKSVGMELLRQGELIDGTRAVFKMNHENGGSAIPLKESSPERIGGFAYSRCVERGKRAGDVSSRNSPLKPMLSAIWNVEMTHRSICF
jgi:hypothetical protein